MDINRIKNETLHKLSAEEIGALGLCNYGVGLYRGELKSRRSGLKAIKVNDYEVHFEGTVYRMEFVKIQSGGDIQEWAARIYRKQTYPNEVGYGYETYPGGPGIGGCDYFR